MRATINRFTSVNAMVNRWPLPVRRDINRSHVISLDPHPEGALPPFHTWAQPRFLERRKQAVAVWCNLLRSLILHWLGYGGKDGSLHSLGLQPSREGCDVIDTLRLYTTLPAALKPRSAAVAGMVDEFFLLVLRDPTPTARANPLLWWIAIHVHCEIEHPQPRLSILGLEDKLDFPTKLEALDHYARVLIFHCTFIAWANVPGIFHSLPDWKLDVAR